MGRKLEYFWLIGQGLKQSAIVCLNLIKSSLNVSYGFIYIS
jgi:hypothetical protein